MSFRIGATFAAGLLAVLATLSAAQAEDETRVADYALSEPPAFTLERVIFEDDLIAEESPSRSLSTLLASVDPALVTESARAEQPESLTLTEYSLAEALEESLWRHRVAQELEALSK